MDPVLQQSCKSWERQFLDVNINLLILSSIFYFVSVFPGTTRDFVAL